eukprot:6098788-Pyramimonas_sp.AAC.1
MPSHTGQPDARRTQSSRPTTTDYPLPPFYPQDSVTLGELALARTLNVRDSPTDQGRHGQPREQHQLPRQRRG